MLKKTKLKVAFISALTALVGVFSVTASVAWFGKASVINTNEMGGIDGAVLTSYFHCGTGTESDPFVITRPKHWQNLVWLHNNIEGFYNANNPSQGLDGKGYYFQVGYDLDEDGDLEVFDYKDDGTPNFEADSPSYSQTLNLTVFSEEGEELIPLGSPQRPFIGELDGSNIKLTGFKVVAVDADNDDFQLEDIGIFGYVGPSGYVHDIYFSDYTINTNGAKIHDETDYELHTPHLRVDSDFPHPCIGSIAGHIMVAESFENVYTNRCTIEGTEGDSESKLNNYSYYGVVEIPTEGGHVGPGDNYDFTFSSSAVYNYMRQNYNTINNNPMRARNTEYVDELVHDNEFNSDNSTKTPLNGGIRYVTSGLNSYNLIGDDPDDYSAQNPYTGHNYSLSTLGYQPLSADSKTFTYEALTEDGHQKPRPDANLSDKTYKQTMATNESFMGYNIAWNQESGQWEYYHIETTPVDPRTVTINLKINDAVRAVASGYSLTTEPTKNRINVSASLYIDDTGYTVESSEFTWNFTYQTRGGFWPIYTYQNPYFEVSSFSKTLSNIVLGIGSHHVALVFHGHITSGITQLSEFYVAYASNVTVNGNNDRLDITPKNFELDQHAVDGATFNWVFDSSNLTTGSTGTNAPNTSIVPQAFQESDKKPFIISDGWTKKLVGYDETTGLFHDLDSPDFKFKYDNGYEEQLLKLKYDDSGNIVYDPTTGFPVGIKEYEDGRTEDYVPTSASEIVYGEDESGTTVPINILISTQVRDPKWVATREAPKALAVHTIVDEDSDGICDVCEQSYIPGETSHPDKPVFIADDPILTESGYSAENIDVVGGGFQFSNTFVTIDGEDSRALTSPINAGNIGSKWYATEHAANSIVLYLSNVGGLNDSDVMGNIEFDYAWTTAGGYIQTNFKSMVFKKGGTTRQNGYVYMNNQLAMEDGDYEEVSRGTLSTTVKMKLRRGIVKKCAYAALDKNGNILCGYDSNGRQVGYTGEIDENQIKTYVLLVGVKNNITWLNINTRIEEIRFSYRAPKGFGGSFGSVGYRDPYQKLEFTVLNFYFLVPAGDKFRVTVSYSGPDTPSASSKGRYDVTFLYNSSTHDSLEVLFYLYEIDSYEVYCNGTRVAETGNGKYDVTSSNWS